MRTTGSVLIVRASEKFFPPACVSMLEKEGKSGPPFDASGHFEPGSESP